MPMGPLPQEHSIRAYRRLRCWGKVSGIFGRVGWVGRMEVGDLRFLGVEVEKVDDGEAGDCVWAGWWGGGRGEWVDVDRIWVDGAGVFGGCGMCDGGVAGGGGGGAGGHGDVSDDADGMCGGGV